jgi:hypothetical protein
MKYYVYQLIDPRSNTIFYVGKGTGNRAYSHNKFKDGNNNFYKNSIIKELHQQGAEPIVEIVDYFANEQEAYEYEDKLIETIGIDNLTNITKGVVPPSKLGWAPSKETLARRSKGLKGIPRTEEWRKKLSLSKQGTNNPMYGKKTPCTEERRLAVLRGKNAPNYDRYNKAIVLMNNGKSADAVSKELGMSRGVCFRLKNRTHGFFQTFPELI